ncbi:MULTISPECIES: hypothetical protein [unclassified Stenotrophomonas]|uniref:hypothetical protein n=1 Tax=unclassified Stenotrophomonas TaxID=196198 RepID=UPI00190E1B1A|nr:MULTISPECIES: hypothetical protein [unclassified Stenotrophomonas]MBK0054905.1 hypothetical protein [Stenotrophomonas sp. S39]MDI9273321.1 hypothetical protein [Stenotrophomonas sp. PFBMAA-4]
MDDANDPHLAMRATVDLLDEVLDVAGLENDARATATLAMAFCDRLGDRLDADQRAAVDAARCYWSQQDRTGRRRWHAVYASRLDQQRGLSPVDRLVWCSLVDNAGLTGYMGECLVLEALAAGLGLDEVEAVLCGSVPGFAAARINRPR